MTTLGAVGSASRRSRRPRAELPFCSCSAAAGGVGSALFFAALLSFLLRTVPTERRAA